MSHGTWVKPINPKDERVHIFQEVQSLVSPENASDGLMGALEFLSRWSLDPILLNYLRLIDDDTNMLVITLQPASNVTWTTITFKAKS